MRLFVAVWPSEEATAEVASAVAAMRSAHAPESEALRWTGPAQWHVTLRFLGDADPSLVVPCFRSATTRDGFGPATAVTGPVTGCFGARVLHVPVAGLDGLAAAVTTATAGVGEQPDDRGFAGHLTLARSRASVRGRRGSDLVPFAGRPLTARWPVTELTLVASRTGRDGGHYEVLDAVPVEGPCPNTRSQLH